jgi:hypothetical protein
VTAWRIPIEDLRLPVPVSAGMNYLKIGFYVYELRATTKDHEPIAVRPCGDGSYRITDGRHRAISALVAGRRDVLATLEED